MTKTVTNFKKTGSCSDIGLQIGKAYNDINRPRYENSSAYQHKISDCNPRVTKYESRNWRS